MWKIQSVILKMFNFDYSFIFSRSRNARVTFVKNSQSKIFSFFSKVVNRAWPSLFVGSLGITLFQIVLFQLVYKVSLNGNIKLCLWEALFKIY